jgi:hypothetical protein
LDTKKEQHLLAKRQDKTAWNSADVQYASVTLSEADKAAFNAWFGEAEGDFEVWLENLVNQSYRVSVKYDYNNNCFQATLTQQDAKHVNSGLTIISRASSSVEAVLMSAYKVDVMYPDQRLPVQDRDSTWG